MIGRKTNGGRVMTSNPLRPELVVSTTGEALGVGTGDSDGVGEGEGDGVAAGVGVGAPWSVKLAQGLGGTLAHRWCTPGLSPGKGVTALVKLPPPSVVTFAATCESLSQTRAIDSLARKDEPVTVIWVLGPPAAMSSTMFAPTGMGVGVGDGLGAVLGDGEGLGDGLGVGVGVGDGPCAVSTSQTGTTTRTLRNLTRRPKGTSDRGPRDRPGGRRFRESPARVQDAAEAAPQDVDLGRVEQAVDGARQGA